VGREEAVAGVLVHLQAGVRREGGGTAAGQLDRPGSVVGAVHDEHGQIERGHFGRQVEGGDHFQDGDCGARRRAVTAPDHRLDVRLGEVVAGRSSAKNARAPSAKNADRSRRKASAPASISSWCSRGAVDGGS
jgi:hypothetical protein